MVANKYGWSRVTRGFKVTIPWEDGPQEGQFMHKSRNLKVAPQGRFCGK